MDEDRYDETDERTEVIPKSKRFVAALGVGMLFSVILIAVVGWRRKVARKKSPSSPIPEP
jgi:hypothetical protein